MKATAGSILIHAAAVVFAAHCLATVRQSPAALGPPEAGYVTLAAGVLGLAGVGVLIAGLATDRRPLSG